MIVVDASALTELLLQTPTGAEEAIADLADLDLRRHSHALFVGRAWELRANLTAYDAMYVALAEAIDAPLVTCDRALGKAPGHAVRVQVVR